MSCGQARNQGSAALGECGYDLGADEPIGDLALVVGMVLSAETGDSSRSLDRVPPARSVATDESRVQSPTRRSRVRLSPSADAQNGVVKRVHLVFGLKVQIRRVDAKHIRLCSGTEIFFVRIAD